MIQYYCEQLRKVNINAVCRQYPQLKRLSQVSLSLGSGVHKVRLERSRMHFGGTRTWFTCPCGKRVGVIYKTPDKLGCLHCLNIDHLSRWESGANSSKGLRRRIAKLRALLDSGDRRPKYMHSTTYERLLHEIERLEDGGGEFGPPEKA